MPPAYVTTANGIHVPTSANAGTDFALGLKQMGDDVDALIYTNPWLPFVSTGAHFRASDVLVAGVALFGYAASAGSGVLNVPNGAFDGTNYRGAEAAPFVRVENPASGLGLRFRLGGVFVQNATAIGTNMFVELFPVTGGGTGGAVTVGAAAASIGQGSSANSLANFQTTTFTLTNGLYVLGARFAAAPAAGSDPFVQAILEYQRL